MRFSQVERSRQLLSHSLMVVIFHANILSYYKFIFIRNLIFFSEVGTIHLFKRLSIFTTKMPFEGSNRLHGFRFNRNYITFVNYC